MQKWTLELRNNIELIHNVKILYEIMKQNIKIIIRCGAQEIQQANLRYNENEDMHTHQTASITSSDSIEDCRNWELLNRETNNKLIIQAEHQATLRANELMHHYNTHLQM